MTWLMMPVLPAAISANISAAGFPPANLLDPQPKVVFAFGAGFASAWVGAILVDLGADQSIDTVALMFHNGSSTGTWHAYYRTAAEGAFPSALGTPGGSVWFGARSWRPSVVGKRLRHHALYAGAPITARYIRLHPSSPDGSNPDWTAGVLAIGKRLEPGRDTNEMRGFDWGGGRRMEDGSEVRTHDGGEQSSWRRAVVPSVRGTFSHLTDAELAELEDIVQGAGKTQPLLLQEAEDALGAASQARRLHYGTLIEADYFERRMADKNRFEVRLKNIL